MKIRSALPLAIAVLTAISPTKSKADTIAFPSGLIPFQSLYYKTMPDSNGYSLILGEAAPLLQDALKQIATPEGVRKYSTGEVELAPGFFFNDVLVPTSLQLLGNFSDFGGQILDPTNSNLAEFPTLFAVNYGLLPEPRVYIPFVSNYIPRSRMYGLFAFEVGPDTVLPVAPEPTAVLLVFSGLALLSLLRSRWVRRRET